MTFFSLQGYLESPGALKQMKNFFWGPLLATPFLGTCALLGNKEGTV